MVISMVSSNLIRNTDLNMVCGGLPYLLTSPSRLRLVIGDRLEDHPIQTSALCHYSAMEVEEEIRDVLKMKVPNLKSGQKKLMMDGENCHSFSYLNAY